MKTILVLARHRDFIEAIRTGLNPGQCRIVERTTLEEVAPLLEHGLADACIVDVESAGAGDLGFLENLCRKATHCPVIAYTGERPSELEAEAYLKGVTYALTKPVQGRVLTALLDRVWLPAAATRTPYPVLPYLPPQSEKLVEPPTGSEKMGVLRSFSGILTHALNEQAMLQDFLLLLRETFSIDRAAIFLQQPHGSFTSAPAVTKGDRLGVARALGLSQALLQPIELSSEIGIGGHLFRFGRILRRSSEEARRDATTQQEFEWLGTQVAVPITDGESVFGMTVLGGRITGEPLVNSELEVIFHLHQQLGVAIKNIWLHDEIAGSREMMAEVLSELSSACVVISQDMAVLHSNKMAGKYFNRSERRDRKLEFLDLPAALGAKVYQVLKTSTAISNFRYEPQDSSEGVFNINIVPLQKQPTGLPRSVVLLAEDLTQIERLHRLEIEAANLGLVKTMAYRLTNEISNAMVAIVAHHQLLAERWADQEFRASLSGALANSTRRVNRLGDQMRFLALEGPGSQQTFPIAPLIEEAFKEARRHQPTNDAQFKCEVAGTPIMMKGNRAAIKHALVEILINALQANRDDPKIAVRVQTASDGTGPPSVQIEVQDNGAGFTAEVAQKAPEAFFTTRIVGSGLGLTVSRKIIESHQGKLELVPASPGQVGRVRVSLPLTLD
jgi:signal transduction histidine kinase